MTEQVLDPPEGNLVTVPVYDADVALLAPLRASGLEQASMIWALTALADAGYRVQLFDTSSVRGTTKWAKVHDELLALLGRDNIALGLPQSTYRVQSAVAFRPSDSITYDAVGSSIIADRAVLVSDIDLDGDEGQAAETVTELLDALSRSTRTAAMLAASTEYTRQRLIEVGFEPIAGEWTFGTPSGAISEVRDELVDDAAIRIGRHVRGAERPWPQDDQVIRRSLPTTSEWAVHVFGSHGGMIKRLGHVPSLWTLNHLAIPADLERLDFWVPVEELTPESPADLSIDEAIAAGLVVILPTELEGRYGRGAIYASPGGIRSGAKAYHSRFSRYEGQSRRAIEYAWSRRAERVVELLREQGLGDPSEHELPEAAPTRPRDGRKRFRILFVTSNGAGMGHLTRLLGIARTISDRAEVVFASLSQASPVVTRFGFPFVYIASATETGLAASAWNNFARERFGEEFALLRPDAVVFDGTWLYNGLASALRDASVPLIWSRRGMWKPEISDRSLLNASKAIGIIEPGEFASDYDRGQTARVKGAFLTDPVTILSPEELLSASDARARLGLAEGEKALLVTLGAGNLNAIDTTLAEVVAAMQEIAPTWRLFLTSNPIAGGVKTFSNAETLEYYPVAELAHAFEATVSAAGYNSYHEWMSACVPTIWIPNLQTQTDDQLARAKYADDEGVGICVDEPTTGLLRAAIARLVDDVVRGDMREQLEARRSPNGAHAAGEHILSLLEGGR